MWGDVTPAERLRAVTRRRAGDEGIAAEAADALTGFASDPASLVVACRRVLAHHARHAPLWWVCARILAAAEPGAAARDAARLLESDRTGDRLGAALPILDEGQVVAILGWSPAIDAALLERFDVDAVVLRIDGDDPVRALRRRQSDHAVRVLDPWDPTLTSVPRVLVHAHAIGPDAALVPAGTRDALDAVRGVTEELWLVSGIGRVLPARLYDALVAAVDPDNDDVESLSLQRVDRVAGPRGLERSADASTRTDCPVVPELLRPLG
jgi:hypothetical protein